MKITERVWTGIVAGMFGIVIFTGCKPKTTAEKIEDKVEDAGHEVGQAAERAGEQINDAANK